MYLILKKLLKILFNEFIQYSKVYKNDVKSLNKFYIQLLNIEDEIYKLFKQKSVYSCNYVSNNSLNFYK